MLIKLSSCEFVQLSAAVEMHYDEGRVLAVK